MSRTQGFEKIGFPSLEGSTFVPCGSKPECSRAFQGVPGRSRTYQGVPGRSMAFEGIPKRSRALLGVPGVPRRS